MSVVPIIEYFKPLRAVITIRDKRNDPTYLYHNSFDPPDPSSGSPAIYYCDVDLAYGQAGTFTLRINDHEHQLDDTKIGLGNKVWIQAGRDEDHLFNLFSGVVRTMKPIRQNYNLLGYEMSGFGTQIIMNERVVNYLRTSIRDPANPNKPFVLDPNMTANKLFKVLMTATDIIPTGFPAIKHTLHAGMFNTEEQIDPIVDTFIASLTEPYVEASQVANSIADMAGGIWGVVPQAPGEPDKVFLRFPSLIHSGTIIKDKPSDPEEYTSRNVAYLRAQTGGFSYTDSMRKEDGFTNRIFSKTGADQASGSTSTAAENFTLVAGIDIAQQITINSTRLRDIAFTFGITGKGDTLEGGGVWSPVPQRFNIVNDVGNRPGPIVELFSEFDVHALLNNGDVKPIFLRVPEGFQFRSLKPGDKAWVFMQSAGVRAFGPEHSICGDPNPNFGFHWHHDGGNTGVSAIRTVCDPKGEGNRDPPATDMTSGWVVNTAGPIYSHTFFDQFSHIIEASDQESINKYGEVDSFIDASFLTDENAMNQYLSSILQFSAKPRRIYEFAEVFIPYDHPIEPGSLVTVIDPVSGHNTNLQTAAEVQEVRYEFAADASGRTPLGTNTCEIRLLGYVDFRERHVLAISEQSIQGPLPTPGPPDPGLPPPPPPPPPPPEIGEMDTDGVKIIYPRNNSQGKFHHNLFERVGGASSFDGDDILEMDIEGNATKQTSGSLTYWRCISREGSFQSGGTNWTSRPEWVSNHCNTPSGVSGAKSRGYLCNANDPKSVECTIIFRVDGIHDNSEEATMGIRGDDHSDGNEKCLQQKNFFPYSQRTSNLWGFEKSHPDAVRRAVTFVSPYSSSNQPTVGEMNWRGMKLVAWNVNNNQAIHCEMWIDESPINPSGGYNNNWKKVWIYEEQRSDTPTWGGPRQQFRVDMCDELHLAAFSCHEIIPPGNPTSADYSETDARSQTATAEVLAEKAEYEETTGMTHPDYISEMVEAHLDPETGLISEDSAMGSGQEILDNINATEEITSGETGNILRPKTIARESHPIIAERDEIDATFGE